MLKLKQKFPILGLILLGVMASASDAKAQFAPTMVDTGSIIPDMPLKDIYGNTTHLYDYLDSGYTIAIEFFLTTCTICWEFRKDGVFEDLYEKYGPTGTVKPRKIMPMMIEMNEQTTSADMKGTGPRTVGDWTEGVKFPIIDLNATNFMLLGRFQRQTDLNNPTAQITNTPTYMIICPNRKVIYTAEGAGAFTEQNAVNLMENKCTAGKPTEPTGLKETVLQSSLRIYPNPGKSVINVNVETLAAAEATFTITNILGQSFVTELVSLAHGTQTVPLNIGQLSAGIYILTITTDKGMAVQEKFVVEK